MPWIRGFLWDDENVAHVGRHQVSPDEVEEALMENPVILRGPDGRSLAYGRTVNGRIRVLMAREMTDKEKRFYRKKRRG